MLHYSPKDLPVPDVHKLLLGGVAPRPIALVSTISKSGINNLSPFSFFNAFGSNPPVIAFSPSRRGRDGTLKDTYHNLIDTKECVVNAVTNSMVEQINLASAEFAPEVDEFVKSGLTSIDSEIVKPKRVKESPFQMECKLIEMKSIGDKGGSANIAICEVIMFHVAEDIFSNNIIDPLKIDQVSRMSGNFYSRASLGIFKVEKPIGKQCVGYDQIPKFIRESEVYSANDLGKFGNAESIPSVKEVEDFINKIMEEKIDELEISFEAIERYERLGDYKKMLKSTLLFEGINKNVMLQRTAKCALSNNDNYFAWCTAIHSGNIQ